MADARRHAGPAQRTEYPAGSSDSVRAESHALRAAADAVLADTDAWRRQALGREEAAAVMDEIVGFVLEVPAAEQQAGRRSGGEVSLALRLQELLCHRILSGERTLPAEQQLELLRKLDGYRAAVYPDDRQNLAFLLTGANALELVVELAHDLRSPLTSIMFLAETLRKGQSGEINDLQRQQLGIVYSAALSMVGVANDVMDLATSRSDGAWERAQDEEFSIKDLVEGVRDVVAPMLEQKRLGFSFFTPRNDTRLGRPVPLTRVLVNLVSNAIKFTETGRVEIVVGEVGGERDNRVEFSVRDTGPGMSRERLDAVHDLFTRSRSSTGYHFSDTGLGLSICHRMVTLLGGQLHVDSRPGEGTRFHFVIPLPRG